MAATVIDTLFGDLPVEQWPRGDDADEFPWSAFVEARRNPDRAVELWLQIARADGVEPRHVAQAWHFLRAAGVQPEPDEAGRVLGLVVEVGMKNGADVLAVYADRSVRYYNHAGGGIVLEPAPPEHIELVGRVARGIRRRRRGDRPVGRAAARPAGPEVLTHDVSHARRPAFRSGPDEEALEGSARRPRAAGCDAAPDRDSCQKLRLQCPPHTGR
jgi:hypothetical protein